MHAIIGQHSSTIHTDAFDLLLNSTTAALRCLFTGKTGLPVQVPQFCKASIHLCTET